MSGAVPPATIHPTVFVATGAVVLGDVTIGPRASVWFNTVVRADSAPVSIGQETNVQDNSVVHEDEGFPARIGDRVTVGHRSIIHGCVIENDCLIGMGSVILTGARVGAGSLIGAASLVVEHQVIPPGSLAVGSPARVVGPVGPQHHAAIRNGAEHYAALARHYMDMGLARSANPRGSVTGDRGPMTRREWQDLIRALEEGPAQSETRLDARGSGGAADPATGVSSLDHERIVLVSLVAGREPGSGSVGRLPGAGLEAGGLTAGAEARATLCRLLWSLGPDEWGRVVGHPQRGALTLAEWVREWVDEDLAWRAADPEPK